MNQIYDVSPDALSNLLLTLYFDIALFDGRLPALYAPVTAVPLGEPPIRNLTLVWAADIFAWRDSPVWNTSALRVTGKTFRRCEGFKRLERFERGSRARWASWQVGM